jgi:hypothetical protein
MRRILLLVTVASMLAAAMAFCGVVQAKPISDKADAQCAKLTIQTLGPSYNPSNYTFHGGTEGGENFDVVQATEGIDEVFCGFGGADRITNLQEGDIFLGGLGDDFIEFNVGTFYGEEGNDFVLLNFGDFDQGPI